MDADNELIIYATPFTIGALTRLWRGAHWSDGNGVHTIHFNDANVATSFAHDASGWDITLQEPIRDFNAPVLLKVKETPHAEDIHNGCNRCKRSTCETHLLCYCADR